MSARIAARLGRALLLGQAPSYLIAFVTGRCGLGCSFCCPASRSARGSDELAPEAWARGLEGARALLHLTITGGEPFEREDLLPLVMAMVRTTGVPRLSINTNGQHPSRVVALCTELSAQLPGVPVTISISIDGPEPLHDQLRGRPGAWSAARETVMALDPLRRETPALAVRLTSVLQPDNRRWLESFLDETEFWPVDFHELALLRDVPVTVQRSLAEDYRRLTRRQLARASRRYSDLLDWRLARALRRDVLGFLEGGDGAGPCTAGGAMVEVLPDGTVLGCEAERRRGDARLGSIADGARLVDILSGPAAARFRAGSQGCRCTSECAATCNTVFRPQRWAGLL